ncbi:ribbon-helix-helix protein, CopG family [Caldicellulosiruptor saccharolyticus]|uniref:ribbon-helix-helix protein, CopG family n=1 Tax=Caldicellulosiruptor saccharolyticus TaxID=44001 RepID=UPI0002FF247C|nr:ribbon-helix-helix protein, CopG family [Caldicellulosiruptor saccharolyticus]
MANKTTTVRVDVETYKSLKKLSEQLNQPMQKIIQEAIAEYKKKILLSATAKAFATLKENSRMWQDEVEERQLWETTLQDGIE